MRVSDFMQNGSELTDSSPLLPAFLFFAQTHPPFFVQMHIIKMLFFALLDF